MSEVKWLLVGAGDIARKRVGAALNSTPSSSVAAICDLRREEAESVATELGASQVFADYAEALATADVDAVYLATPVWLHAGQAIAALGAGKHVLVEKPLGVTGAEAQRVADAAASSDKLAGCSYFRRSSPRYEHAKSMLANGEFGDVVLVRMTYFSWFNPAIDDPKYWRVVPEKSGGGALSDMGSHMFDVLIGLFGMPETVYAKCGNLVQKQWGVEDSASIIMTLTNGAHVNASFNWNSKTWRHEFEIVGSEAKVLWLPYDTGTVTKTAGRDIQKLSLPNAENVHEPLIADFVESILTGRQPLVSAAEAAKTNVLLDAVLRSAKDGLEVSL